MEITIKLDALDAQTRAVLRLLSEDQAAPTPAKPPSQAALDQMAAKPRSQRLLEEACVLVKDEALIAASKLVEAARFDVEKLLLQMPTHTREAVGRVFDHLSHMLEVL